MIAIPGNVRGLLAMVLVNKFSDGLSWIDLAEIRVNYTESRFAACLN